MPILRHHLNFAVQVQRAAQELQLDEQDLIAVGLPESVREPMLEAVGRLPHVSLVISSLSEGDQREVFPVTPGDGIVEAVRIARERGVPLRFVDQEIAPGHLIDHFCVADEDWPDDGLALEYGAEWYLNLVEQRLAHPPARFEPVDTWREQHMAAFLQRLHPRYRRILFVCNATHVRPVQRLLRQPALVPDDAGSALPATKYQIWEPSLPVLLRYLDYIPRLVQQYEAHRAEGTAHTFDKGTALLRLIYRLNEEAADLRLSIRHYQAFSRVLAKLLEGEQRISPTFETVLTACGSCFNNMFKERVFRFLVGYFDQVRVERIGRIRGTRELMVEVTAVSARNSGGPFFVARNCTQFSHFYEVVRVPGREDVPNGSDAPDVAPDLPPGDILEIEAPEPRPKPRASVFRRSDEWSSHSWPPADEFINSMRHKAFHLAMTSSSRQVRSVEFHGSMQDGLDFRRTLRSYYKRQPKLYVRQERPAQRRLIDRNEPIVWLSHHYEDGDLGDPRCDLSYSFSGRGYEMQATEWYLTRTLGVPADLKSMYGEQVQVSSFDIYGRVSFKDWGLTFDEIRDRLGDSLYTRVPPVEVLEDQESFRSSLSAQYGLPLVWTRWWEVLLVAALAYAKETVLLIAPQQFVVPSDITARAAESGKRIARISPARFTHEELRRLGIQYFLDHRYPQTHSDANDPEYRAYLVEQFADVMKRFWE
ncbi:hypothetical protein ACX28W_37030 [Streptomyces sp. SD15]